VLSAVIILIETHRLRLFVNQKILESILHDERTNFLSCVAGKPTPAELVEYCVAAILEIVTKGNGVISAKLISGELLLGVKKVEGTIEG
jgi:hypothetical protein